MIVDVSSFNSLYQLLAAGFIITYTITLYCFEEILCQAQKQQK